MRKRWLGLLMVLVMVISVIAVPETVQAKDKGFLVLTQSEKDGSWTAYDEIGSKYVFSGASVTVPTICEAMGLEYDETDDGFTMSNGKKKLTFINKYFTYKYFNGTKTISKRPPVPAGYLSCYYNVFSDLSVNVTYFTKYEAEKYGVYGYAGVICYSAADIITELPELDKIYNEDESPKFYEEQEGNAPLVLIQTKKNGVWTYYDDIALMSPDGYIMIKALAAAREMGLDSYYFARELHIDKHTKELIFKAGSNEFKQYNMSTSARTLKTSKAESYTDWKYGLDMIHYADLSYLAYTKFYNGDAVADYQAMGYDSIICYSTGGKITEVPDVKKIVKAPGLSVYSKTIQIAGVEIPKLSEFATSALKDTNWGQDVSEYGYRPLEYALNEYAVQMRSDIMGMNIEDNAGEIADIKVLDRAMAADINGDSTMSALRLRKVDDHYEIYISSRLSKNPNKGQPDYSTLGQNVLRLYCAIISSTPEKLFEAIYKDAEVDVIFKKDAWTTVGDAKVMHRIENHAVIYSIKAK